MEKKYVIELNEKQAVIIKRALEEYFRIRMNQWGDLADDLAHVGFTYDKNDPNNRSNFNAYIERRDNAKRAFEGAMLIAQPQRVNRVMEISEDVLIAEDIWQVIRHQLFIDNGGDLNSCCVDTRKPLQMSQESLPKMYLSSMIDGKNIKKI